MFSLTWSSAHWGLSSCGCVSVKSGLPCGSQNLLALVHTSGSATGNPVPLSPALGASPGLPQDAHCLAHSVESGPSYLSLAVAGGGLFGLRSLYTSGCPKPDVFVTQATKCHSDLSHSWAV